MVHICFRFFIYVYGITPAQMETMNEYHENIHKYLKYEETFSPDLL